MTLNSDGMLQCEECPATFPRRLRADLTRWQLQWYVGPGARAWCPKHLPDFVKSFRSRIGR